jgi:hypothetical protein
MAVNYVKGQILSSILERDGINLSIANASVGINTTSPVSALDVHGTITVGNITIPNVGNVRLGNVNINNLAAPYANSDAATKFYVDNQISNVGPAVLGNLSISNTTITTTLANGNISLNATGNTFVQVGGTYGLVIPSGNTAQRLSTGNVTGTTRFNTTTSKIEIYTGNTWAQIATDVTNQTLNGNGVATAFTLNRETSAAAALVMLNGITQVPNQAYSMSPDPSTNLVFTEAPATGDVIDVRFL